MSDTKIKMIRKMPDGDRLLVLWIGILCIGMKSGKPGVLEIGDGIPFDAETLSTELDLELNTVKFGLKMFHDYKMIEISQNETIFIKNFEKHQNIKRIEKERKKTRKRVQNYRKRQRLLIEGVTRNNTVTNKQNKNKIKKEDTEIDLELYKNEWNQLALKYGLSKIVSFTNDRIKKLKTRINRDHNFYNHFKLSLEKIPESDFLLGKTGKWKVAFDFLIKNSDNCIKICEDQYKSNKNKKPDQLDALKEFHNMVDNGELND
jgi:predicted phage replisome organizer